MKEENLECFDLLDKNEKQFNAMKEALKKNENMNVNLD